MKKVLIFIFLLAFLSPKAQNNAKQEKLIRGTWKYNVAYDTIAEVDTTDFYKPYAEREKKMFFTKIKVKKTTAKLSDYLEKWNVTWEIKNSNELYFFLEDKKILKYLIIKLTDNTLELREPNSKVSTLVYYK
ncbi:lipocalin family protein [Flavobacterium sp. RSP29]|uniref:lipocalin family protein n=1 Tax=Flavobacterium sp. RSP29 TaxID=3401731 RepID=UPI003AAC4344